MFSLRVCNAITPQVDYSETTPNFNALVQHIIGELGVPKISQSDRAKIQEYFNWAYGTCVTNPSLSFCSSLVTPSH
jgi:hypothetical protein